MANAVLSSESTGVIPLPALRATRSPPPPKSPPPPRVNTPAGRVTSMGSPGARWSFIQFDTTPSGVRFTVTLSSVSTTGADDIE